MAAFFYSKSAATNSATHAGFSCPLISMVQLKVTFIRYRRGCQFL